MNIVIIANRGDRGNCDVCDLCRNDKRVDDNDHGIGKCVPPPLEYCTPSRLAES